MTTITRYKPCRCGGLAACYCGQLIETRFLKTKSHYSPQNDRFWVHIEWLSRGLPMP
jgi:hypothetical protein